MTHAAVQVCSSRVVVGVEVVQLHIPHVAHGVHEAVRQVHGDGRGTPIVADKEEKGIPLAGVAPGLKSITYTGGTRPCGPQAPHRHL